MPCGQVDTVRNKVSLCLLFLTTVTVDLRAVIKDTTVINYMIGKKGYLIDVNLLQWLFYGRAGLFSHKSNLSV